MGATLRGLFYADFEEFYNACEKATTKLAEFSRGAEAVGPKLDKLVDSFSGRNVIQQATLMAEAIDRIGGASMLTEKELARVSTTAAEAAAKLKAMGADVPENIARYAKEAKNAEGATSGWSGALGNIGTVLAGFGLAVTIEQIIGLTKEIFAQASALEKLHDTTDISVEDLQRMEMVGAGVGVSLETMTSASLRLQTALGKGDKGVAAALADLNIDLDHFKQLGAADQLAAVATATATIEDPLRRAADLSALYGKSWADLFPVLKKGFADAGDDVTVMSSRTVAALDGAGNAVGEFWRATKANLGEAFADILTLSTSEWRRLKSGIDEATEAATKMHAKGITPLSTGLVDTSDAVATLNAGLDAQKTQLEADVAAQKKYNDAWIELNAVGGTWQDTVAGIATETAALAKYYLEAGVSQSAIASGLNLTTVEVKALATSVKEAEDAYKKWAATEAAFNAAALKHQQDLRKAENQHGVDLMKEEADTYKQLEKVRADYHDADMKASMDATTYKITKIWEAAQAQVDAFQGTGERAQEHADLVYSIAAIEAQGITDVMAGALDQMYGKATFVLGQVEAKATEAVTRANQQYSMVGGRKLTERELDEYYKTPAGIEEMIRNGGKRYHEGEVMPRAMGGPVSAGDVYLVGERGPELFVPQASGAVLPNGSGGGRSSVVNHIYVNGTAEEVARKVAAEIMRTIKAGQQLGAWGT